jgi:hypothetical protein
LLAFLERFFNSASYSCQCADTFGYTAYDFACASGYGP